jgi:hypothetical protein
MISVDNTLEITESGLSESAEIKMNAHKDGNDETTEQVQQVSVIQPADPY